MVIWSSQKYCATWSLEQNRIAKFIRFFAVIVPERLFFRMGNEQIKMQIALQGGRSQPIYETR